MADDEPSSAPLSWRDVYRLVEKSEERSTTALTGIREDIRAAASTFQAYVERHDREHEKLDERGTEGFRETAAEAKGRTDATREILDISRATKRWVIGLAIPLAAIAITLAIHMGII